MSSRLASFTVKETLRQYAQGAAQKATAPVADFLAPTVEVGSPTGYYKIYSERNRFQLPSTKRALGGRAVELVFSASDGQYNLTPHAIDCPVDNLERLGDSDLENSLMESADACAEVGGLVHEKEVIDLALSTVGAGTDSNFTSGSVDPIDVIDQAIMDVMKAAQCGSLMGIGVLFGTTAWKRYKNNANVKARFVGGGGGKGKAANEGGSSLVTPNLDAVTALQLGNPEARMSLLSYDAAAPGKAASMTFVLDTAILVFARAANPTRRDPSFMKTFRPRGQWMVPGSYLRDDGRVEVAKMDWLSDPKVTNSAAAIRINATNS